DVNTIEDARMLAGMDLCLDENQKDIFKIEEIPAAFLQGFTLLDQNGIRTGIITAIIDNPAHYLLELDHDKLIPFHEDLIINMDTDNKCVTLRIADGLLDN
ncbi:hypothetical protein ACFLRI_04325, partial [Bacteroidota bacterium]